MYAENPITPRLPKGGRALFLPFNPETGDSLDRAEMGGKFLRMEPLFVKYGISRIEKTLYLGDVVLLWDVIKRFQKDF